jgi:uncharacterized protein (DUF1015 family)
MKNFASMGLQVPSIFLPSKDIDMTKWSVVACDQYTSQKEYWENVKSFVGNNPSALNLIFPEVYLEEKDKEKRIASIHEQMQDYLDQKILVPQKPGIVYVERKTRHADLRNGILLCVDLEEYDYKKGSESLIRATEGTVLERLPPRIQIRKNAPLEVPHIMILIDDPKRTVIEPLAAKTKQFRKLYDFELMMKSGHITGYMVDDKSTKEIETALGHLADESAFSLNYPGKRLLLFAMGDGNHSLATAKAIWEEMKKGGAKKHPARYALVEIVNVHDAGIVFEPIHRVIFNVPNTFFDDMDAFFDNEGMHSTVQHFSDKVQLSKAMKNGNGHMIPFITAAGNGLITLARPKYTLVVAALQSFLDEYVKKTGCKIDYIHGESVVEKLGSEPDNVGFFLPAMNKNDLFKTVIIDGALPRKTFSMGEADEKRFYLETRIIR